ncbi:MAG: thioredoxin [Phycisphaerales bacterium]
MQRVMLIQLVVGLAIGGGIGAAMGYFGKCTTGACPLTANPLRGGLLGAMFGGLLSFSMVSPRTTARMEESGELQIATAEDFDARVLGAGQPVLVDFYSTTCGPCRMLAPTIEKLAKQYEGRAVVYKVNVDRLPELASRYGIEGVPSVLFFQSGKEVNRLIGLRQQHAYTEVLDRLLTSA